MLKKILLRFSALFALTAVLLCALAGCSGGDKIKLDPNNPTAIVIWHYYHGAQKTAFDNAVKEFNETVGYEQGIIVEAVSHGGVGELADNVLAAAKGELDAGEMPDIFGAHGDTALEIFNMGKAVEIDNYMSEAELAEYEDSFIREGRIGTDKLYIFPIAKCTESLMLNKTDFDAFADGLKASGLNESVSYEDLSTWEGILRVADVYYRYTQSISPDKTGNLPAGKAFMGIDGLANYLIAGSKQLGQDLVEVKDGKASINLDRDIMSKLWYTYYEPMVTGKFIKLGRFCSDDIKTGDSLCFVGATTSASYFPAELPMEQGAAKSIEMMVLPMPVFENGDKVAVSQGAGMVIAKSVREKEYASAVFLKWFTQAERNILFSLTSSYLPVKKDALDDKLLNAAFDAIDASNVETQNSIKALRVGVEQLRSYNLYFSEVFDGGADFRSKLPLALENAVLEDRDTYLKLIQEGLAPEEAYPVLLESSRGKFDAWLISLGS